MEGSEVSGAQELHASMHDIPSQNNNNDNSEGGANSGQLVEDEDEPSPNYRLEIGLLFPLKVSLFPVKSSPSVLVDHSNSCEPVLVMVEDDCSGSSRKEVELSEKFGDDIGSGSAVELRRKNRSLMRRRSTSVPDLDKLVLLRANHDSGLFYDNSAVHHPHCIIECEDVAADNNNFDEDRSHGNNLLLDCCHHNYHHPHRHPCVGHPDTLYGNLYGAPCINPISGAKSLPRISRDSDHDSRGRGVNVSHKSGSLATLPTFGGVGLSPTQRSYISPGGHIGSVGDWMNDFRYRHEGQRQELSSSEKLAAAVPLDTVTCNCHRRTPTETSFQSITTTTTTMGTTGGSSSNKNSVGPLSSTPSPPGSQCLSLKSIPKLNIYAVESDVFDGSSPDLELGESSLKSGYSSVRSLNRLFVIHGYNENEGIITISGPSSPSRRSSRSRSGSFSDSEASATSSFRIQSRSGSPATKAAVVPSGCCGVVNLRGSPLPTSPPYQSSCADAPTSRSCFGTPTPRTSGGIPMAHYFGESTSTSTSSGFTTNHGGGRESPSGSSSTTHTVDDLDVFFENTGETSSTDSTFGFKMLGKAVGSGGRKGIIGMAILDTSRPVQDSQEKLDPLKQKDWKQHGGPLEPSQKSNHHHQALPATKLVSIKKRGRSDVRNRGGGGEATFSSGSSTTGKGHPEDTDKCAELQVILPTIERAKRLSRLIQHRQHLQLQYSLNLNFMVGAHILQRE